jgi:amidase
LTLRTVSDIVAYKQDSLDKIPYGQGRFEKILDSNLSEELAKLRVKLHDAGVELLKTMTEHHSMSSYPSITGMQAKLQLLTIHA